MDEYLKKLKEETTKGLDRINRKHIGRMERSLLCAQLLGETFDRMKSYFVQYTFKDDAQEIYFFKHVKPYLCSHLIFHRKLYNFELNRPVGECGVQRRYLNRELDRIQEFIDTRREFYNYYKSKATHLDHLYFKRGVIDTNTFLEISRHERDPLFSTDCDFKASRILANDMFREFLEKELVRLEQHLPPEEKNPQEKRLTWKLKKIFLWELIHALYWYEAFGSVHLKEVVSVFEDMFSIDLGPNMSRARSEMRERDEPAPLLETLLATFLTKIKRKRTRRPRIREDIID